MDQDQSTPQDEDRNTPLPPITQSRRWTMGAGETHLATVRCYYTDSVHYEGGGFWTVTDVWVKPDHRKRGYGAALMGAMLEVMRYDDLHLTAHPFDFEEYPALPIDDLIAWYERFGFRSSPTAPANMIRRADPRPPRKVSGPIEYVMKNPRITLRSFIEESIPSETINYDEVLRIDGMPVYPDDPHYQTVKRIADHNRRTYDKIRSSVPDDHRCDVHMMQADPLSNIVHCRVCLERPGEDSMIVKKFRAIERIKERKRSDEEYLINNGLKLCPLCSSPCVIPIDQACCQNCKDHDSQRRIRGFL